MRWWRKRSSPKAPITWSTAACFFFSDRRAQGSRKVVGRTATSCLTSSHNNRTSSTDSSGKSRQSWNERTIPTRWRSSGRYSARSIPSSRTVPRWGTTRPDTTSRVVVLPDPLAPINPTMAPGSAVKLTSSTARIPPKVTPRFSTVSRAGPVNSLTSRRPRAPVARAGRVGPCRHRNPMPPRAVTHRDGAVRDGPAPRGGRR